MASKARQSFNRGTGARGSRRLFVAVLTAVGLVLAPFSSLQARADDRSLKLHNVHTGERAVITYMRNGRLDPAGVKQLNQFLRDWRRDEPTNMDPRLFNVIWQAYQESGSRDYIHIISAYRSPKTNEMLRKRSRGVAQNSQHTRGRAMDFFLPDVPLSRLREIGLKMQAGGVGFYPSSGSPFVHLDVGSVRHWPRMTRQQLVKVFPSGGTLHVPSDGKPLPGYDRAMAAYKARQSVGNLAVADLGGSIGRGRIEAAVPVIAAAAGRDAITGGPGIVPGVATLLPRRRPGSEPVATAPMLAAIDDAERAEEAAESGTAVALADMPLPRPAPVTTRAQLAGPTVVADAASAGAPAAQPDVVAEGPQAPQEPAEATAPPTATVVAAADAAAVPLPRPAPVTTRSSITVFDAPPVLADTTPRPAVIVASGKAPVVDGTNMALARARAIAAIRAQLINREGARNDDPIGAAVMAFAPASTPSLRTASVLPAPAFASGTATVPMPRPRPDLAALAGIPGEPPVAAAQPALAAAAPRDPLTAFAAPAEDAAAIAALTRLGSTRQGHFATLITHTAGDLPELLHKPDQAVAIRFTGFVYDGLRTDRFAGRAVAPLTTVDLSPPGGYYFTALR